MKDLRIGVAGSAGTGKSNLAHQLSERFGLPCMTSRKIVSQILKDGGYDYSSGVQVERFLSQGNRQEQIMSQIIAEEKALQTFVSDRPVVDLAAYAVLERCQSDPYRVEEIHDKCQTHAEERYTHIIVCPWTNKSLVDNSLRTLNPWYQMIVHALVLYLLRSWNLPHYVLRTEKLVDRVDEVASFLGLQ